MVREYQYKCHDRGVKKSVRIAAIRPKKARPARRRIARTLSNLFRCLPEKLFPSAIRAISPRKNRIWARLDQNTKYVLVLLTAERPQKVRLDGALPFGLSMPFKRHFFRVLVVDDKDATYDDFRRILCGGVFRAAHNADDRGEHSPQKAPEFSVSTASHGKAGLLSIEHAKQTHQPFALAFVDSDLCHEWTGLDAAKQFLAADEELQVVLCTSPEDDLPLEAILNGFPGANRLLLAKKPHCTAEISCIAVSLCEKWRLTRETQELIRTQSAHIDEAQQVLRIVQSCHDELMEAHQELHGHAEFLEERLNERTIELLGTRDVTMFALAQLAESRDPETGEHLRRMQAYAQRLADHLAVHGKYRGVIGKTWLEDFFRSTPLHDIGKVGIPDSVLLKPGKLTDAEFDIMKRHTLIGAEALERASHQGSGAFLTMATNIARHHHERWDGQGYPYGLKEDTIPLPARVTAVADVFDALTSARVYKDAMAVEDAQQIIMNGRGSHFDPDVVDAFAACYNDFLDIKKVIDGVGDPLVEPLSTSLKWDAVSLTPVSPAM